MASAPRPYALTDHALTALLAVSETDRRSLLAAFDYIAENPASVAEAMTFDWDGFPVHAIRYGRFTIGYLIDPQSGNATITLILPRSI